MARDWEREELSTAALHRRRALTGDPSEPLLHELRGLTADPDTVVSVVMPELIFSGSQTILHNQRALYIKRLLLFEPGVILTSVPFHLR